jgi:hypothetical protein
MKSLEGEGYKAVYEAERRCVCLAGSLRLNGLTEYAPISEMLDEALDGAEHMELDLTRLEFLNSSGIATLSKFVIAARNRKTCTLTIRGSTAVPWQSKSLNNLKRLMPSLELVLE